jgi:heme exporter protein CcmD
MNWHNIVSMGGYGAYVWTAYSITLLALGINLAASWREKKQVKKIIQQFLRHES